MIKKILLIGITAMMLLAGCGGKGEDLSPEAQQICGSWAYNHDKETQAVLFKKDGTALYEDVKYRYTCDEQFIYLTDGKENKQTLRYLIDDDGIYLFKNTAYTFEGENEPNGIVGKWVNEKGWSFEFTEKNTFLEDGYFPGYYILEEEQSAVRLVYSDQFEDTVCYYSINGKDMILEYPWKYVKTQK